MQPKFDCLVWVFVFFCSRHRCAFIRYSLFHWGGMFVCCFIEKSTLIQLLSYSCYMLHVTRHATRHVTRRLSVLLLPSKEWELRWMVDSRATLFNLASSDTSDTRETLHKRVKGDIHLLPPASLYSRERLMDEPSLPFATSPPSSSVVGLFSPLCLRLCTQDPWPVQSDIHLFKCVPLTSPWALNRSIIPACPCISLICHNMTMANSISNLAWSFDCPTCCKGIIPPLKDICVCSLFFSSLGTRTSGLLFKLWHCDTLTVCVRANTHSI